MNNIQSMGIWSSLAMTKNTAYESGPLKLDSLALNAFFSAQVYLTDADNSARLKLQWGVSNDGTNFIYSTDASDDIVTAFAANLGPATNGRNIFSFDPITALWIRFKATETANSVDCVLTLDVAMH